MTTALYELEDETTSLEYLVEAAQAGDRDAFGELATRFEPMVYATAVRRLGNHSEAQELCQEVLVKAMQKLEQLKVPAAFGGWLRSITVRMAINRQVTGFQMPGLEIPEFKAKAIQMAKAGIYDLRIHHDQVVLPVLFKHWKIDQLTDLSEEAKEAREGVMNYLAMLDATATMYEEKRAAAASS